MDAVNSVPAIPEPRSDKNILVRRSSGSQGALLGALFAITMVLSAAVCRAASADGPLSIYFVDVEGGQATLFVTPDGHSLLIDTGWSGNGGRDANRIAAVAESAALRKIDFVLLTHYHPDHAGGVSQLFARIPIGAFIDHGRNRDAADPATVTAWDNYQRLVSKQHLTRIVPRTGTDLPLLGIVATVVSSDGVLLQKPLTEAGAENSACSTAEKRPPDRSENYRSLGIMLTFGAVRILDLGDLTWNQELKLVCPINKLGMVDIFIVSQHGAQESNSPALLNAISPRLAIMDNGADKGGSPSSWNSITHAPGLEDLWQLHYSDEEGSGHNSMESRIANLPGGSDGNYLKLSVWPDGKLEIYNSRTGVLKRYASSPRARHPAG
ncbi:MAG: MBL fold metallo-hydrolase [Steroidobacteraceae bacterium]